MQAPLFHENNVQTKTKGKSEREINIKEQSSLKLGLMSAVRNEPNLRDEVSDDREIIKSQLYILGLRA